MEIVGLIPARGGSRGIPRKNLAELGGRPLLAWTCEAARASRTLGRCVLSTDDEEIADAGRSFGVEVPFLRPPELARDDTPAFPVILDALGRLAAEGRPADIVVLLQPTSPLRRAEHIDAAVELLLASDADTVVSVVRVPHQFAPASLLRRDDAGRLASFLPGGERTLRRQDKEELFARNGPAVYAARVEALVRRGALYGGMTCAYVMGQLDSFDIDDADDLALCDALLEQRGATR